MCTVTFLSTSVGFILTSSRDEVLSRSTFVPQFYDLGDQKIAFPKDKAAGGSWIAASDKGSLACLLNGAYENFIPEERFKVSRGKILLQFFEHEETDSFINALDLYHVAPFTLITMNSVSGEFCEIRWDGNKIHLLNLDKSKNYIWSSPTLYDKDQQQMRESWFEELLASSEGLNRSKLINFHKGKHIDDETANILMKRNNGLQTVSITQIFKNLNAVSMDYFDIVNDERTTLDIITSDSFAINQ